jgi:hypothetical protein
MYTHTSQEQNKPQNANGETSKKALYDSIASELEEIMPASALPSSRKLLEDPQYREIAKKLEALFEEGERLNDHPKPEATIAKGSAETVEQAFDETVLSSLTRVLQNLPFAGVEVLGNFEGFVLAEIADDAGNIILPSEEGKYVLSEGQPYQLHVTIQPQEPLKGIFRLIRLTDGKDVEYVTFTVDLDCDSFKFEPEQVKFTVRARQTEITTKRICFVVEKGTWESFIEVFQKHTIIQSISLELEVQ